MQKERFERFGERLRASMVARRITGPALGKLIGVEKQTISNWKTERNLPRLPELHALCQALRVSADFLVLNIPHGIEAQLMLPGRPFDADAGTAGPQGEARRSGRRNLGHK